MAYDGKEFRPNGVNVAEILRVADLVERSATFDMAHHFHQCGTPACIAGHVLISHGYSFGSTHMAAGILGLNDEQRTRLMLVIGDDLKRLGYSQITNAHAAACLRKLAATGVVDWLGTKPSTQPEGA